MGDNNYGQICSRLFLLRAESTGVAGILSTLRKKPKTDLPIIAIPHARLVFFLYFLILLKNGFSELLETYGVAPPKLPFQIFHLPRKFQSPGR